MDLSEFEEMNAKKDDEFPDEGDGGEELLLQQDIIDAITLLSKVKRLLSYVGDVELCKTVTKRERDVMAKVCSEVTGYLDSVAQNYTEVE